MGLAYNIYLNSKRIYGCKICKTHLADHDEIISRVSVTSIHLINPSPPMLPTTYASPQNFRGQHGKAFLFNSVVNVQLGEAGERNMITGRHVVRDVSCRQCKEVVGWKYDRAYESTEKYKEGKYILEQELMCQVS
ncbi:protein yippee-like moh1 [Friedmanniomyces endolithicus]|nr:protein yippee-like moh1 [Friedmanniomyces endolithicus]KAK1019297.1 protein yippee-like moh1 [Friedmanniomyces endolithicus]